MEDWQELKRRARALESKLERELREYSSFSSGEESSGVSTLEIEQEHRVSSSAAALLTDVSRSAGV